MRIAHISDIHIARSPKPGDINAKRLLGAVNHILFRRRVCSPETATTVAATLAARHPDVVLFTGDMTQLGLPEEFNAAHEVFSVFTQKNIPVLCIPGNHDIYGGSLPPEYDRTARDLALGLAPDSDGIVRLPEAEILLLDQSAVSPPLCAWGRQRSIELTAAAHAWAAPPGNIARIVCGHHPLRNALGRRPGWRRGLHDGRQLEDLLGQCGVAAYFCGHDHKRYSIILDGGCVQYAAPALGGINTVAEGNAALYSCAGGAVSQTELL